MLQHLGIVKLFVYSSLGFSPSLLLLGITAGCNTHFLHITLNYSAEKSHLQHQDQGFSADYRK